MEMRFEDPSEDAESFKISDDNIVLDIGNKISSTDGVMGQYTGLFKLTIHWNGKNKNTIKICGYARFT